MSNYTQLLISALKRADLITPGCFLLLISIDLWAMFYSFGVN